MTNVIISVLIFLILLIFLICLFVFLKSKKINKQIKDNPEPLDELFIMYDFSQGEVHIVNKYLILALNTRKSRFAIIKNFNPKNLKSAVFIELPLLCLTKIKQRRTSVELSYIKDTHEECLKISNVKNDVKDFLHRVFQKANFTAIEKKYQALKFDIVTSSDWQSAYVWAFCSNKSVFVYYDTEKQFVSHQIYLLKTNMTLDVKHSYFEMSVYNISQQLLAYDTDFYDELFNALLGKIKEKYACILKNALYYDNNSSTIYITNSINSLQIINLNTVEEIYYLTDRLSFKIIQNDKTIDYMASDELVEAFKDFVINLNLKRIAQNFDYSSDKLINTSQNTKLIIDYTRSRIVYCANLDKFSKFSYCLISFESLQDVQYIKSGKNAFVRIYLKKDDKIDISCTKAEVAQYISAQIKVIMNE